MRNQLKHRPSLPTLLALAVMSVVAVPVAAQTCDPADLDDWRRRCLTDRDDIRDALPTARRTRTFSDLDGVGDACRGLAGTGGADDRAEAEMLATLLNVGSGRLDADCGVDVGGDVTSVGALLRRGDGALSSGVGDATASRIARAFASVNDGSRLVGPDDPDDPGHPDDDWRDDDRRDGDRRDGDRRDDDWRDGDRRDGDRRDGDRRGVVEHDRHDRGRGHEIGRGHFEHGRGRGLGHEKHRHRGPADERGHHPGRGRGHRGGSGDHDGGDRDPWGDPRGGDDCCDPISAARWERACTSDGTDLGRRACDALDADPDDPCGQARRQAAALHLNLRSGRLDRACRLENGRTVEEAGERVRRLIAEGRCAAAFDLARDVNTGRGLAEVRPCADEDSRDGSDRSGDGDDAWDRDGDGDDAWDRDDDDSREDRGRGRRGGARGRSGDERDDTARGGRGRGKGPK